MKLLFSVEAISSIMVECYRGVSSETGGVLVGPKLHKGIVTDVIPSTSFAERSPTTYCQNMKDVKILNRKLKEFQLKDQDFKGYFHRHPSGLCELSYGDKATCLDILQSPNYKINNFLIMCIITETRTQDFPVFSYITSLNEQKQVVVEKTSIQVLPKTCILKCAECFPPSIATITGENHESKSIDSDSQRVERQNPRRVIRNSNQRIGHNKRPRIKTRA